MVAEPRDRILIGISPQRRVGGRDDVLAQAESPIDPEDLFIQSTDVDQPLVELDVPQQPTSTGSGLLAAYSKAETVDEVKSQSARLPSIARGLLMRDVNEVLGPTPRDLMDRFLISPEGGPEVEGILENSHSFAFGVLDELATKVLDYTRGGAFNGLNPERLSIDRKKDAVSQHVGYASGALSRSPALENPPGREVSRILVRSFFEGTLHRTGGDDGDPRQLLADELSLAAGGEQVKTLVLEEDSLFGDQVLKTPESLLANLSAHHAGEATLQFAARLMNGDDRRAEAFVKHVFGRSANDLTQMLKDPQGLEGVLVNFAAMAHHQAWQWAKLGSAGVAAQQGDESALKMWNHKDIGASRKLLVEDAQAAQKITDQVESYLLREGKLVPCERDGHGDLPLSYLLHQVETQGIYKGEGLRILSYDAVQVRERLWDEVAKASRLSDWQVGNELAADVVSHTCASFASQAVGADFQEREELVELYRDSLERFSPQLHKMLSDGPPEKEDQEYQAFFQEMAGEFGFGALKEHLGVGRAHEVVRNARLDHLIPIACDALRLEARPDFTAENIASDIAELKEGLLNDDYFLGKDGFVEDLQREAAEKAPKVNRSDLENGIRIPNAVWMWTQLTRGLVEKKPDRFTGGEADMSSDKFPSHVQFNPPDIRDVELFVWARHRLTEAGDPAHKATRKALAVVVLTLYKDLVQLRKAA